MGRRIQTAKKPPTPLRKWGEEPTNTHLVSQHGRMTDAECGAAWGPDGDAMTIDRAKVTCHECRRSEWYTEYRRGADVVKDYESYFDEANDGKQFRPLPEKWMDASRFKVGDKIEFLESQRWSFKANGGNLKGCIGTVVKVNPGYGEFPSVWRQDDDLGFWAGEHAGWLTVDFGPEVVFGERTENGKRVPETRRAMTLDEEGRRWRKVP